MITQNRALPRAAPARCSPSAHQHDDNDGSSAEGNNAESESGQRASYYAPLNDSSLSRAPGGGSGHRYTDEEAGLLARALASTDSLAEHEFHYDDQRRQQPDGRGGGRNDRRGSDDAADGNNTIGDGNGNGDDDAATHSRYCCACC